MAMFIPFLAGFGGYGAAAALGASTAVATGVGVATGLGTAALMNQGGGGGMAVPEVAPVETVPAEDTSGRTGSADTSIEDVVRVQQDVANRADTSIERATPMGPSEQEAMSYAQKGRSSTIITRAPGLLTSEATPGTFRRRRTLVGQGLIA